MVPVTLYPQLLVAPISCSLDDIDFGALQFAAVPGSLPVLDVASTYASALLLLRHQHPLRPMRQM